MVAAKKKKTVKTSSKKTSSMKSFTIARDTPPFFSFRITYQTFYWLTLCLLILALGIWVITLNMRVQQLYDQIDASSSDTSQTTMLKDY